MKLIIDDRIIRRMGEVNANLKENGNITFQWGAGRDHVTYVITKDDKVIKPVIYGNYVRKWKYVGSFDRRNETVVVN